jgi:hypothetical protein
MQQLIEQEQQRLTFAREVRELAEPGDFGVEARAGIGAGASVAGRSANEKCSAPQLAFDAAGSLTHSLQP